MPAISQATYTGRGGILTENMKFKKFQIFSEMSEDSQIVSILIIDIMKPTVINLDMDNVQYDNFGNQWIKLESGGYLMNFRKSTNEMSFHLPRKGFNNPIQ